MCPCIAVIFFIKKWNSQLDCSAIIVCLGGRNIVTATAELKAGNYKSATWAKE